MSSREVQVKLTAQVDQFKTAMTDAAKTVTDAQAKQAAAVAKAEAATRKALAAQQALGAAQAKHAAGSNQVTAAETRAAAALKQMGQASQQAKTATDQLTAAHENAAKSTKKLSEASMAAQKAQAGLRAKTTALAVNNPQVWSQVSTGLLGVGAAATAATAAVVKAAIDWESAFAGVKKTTDATEEEYAALSDGLRGLAKEMPTSAVEIAGVAEAAGQLGVSKDHLLEFTKTMVMLGDTTNLTAKDAAFTLSQFMNIMGTAPENVNRLGSALVDLGNNSATTERTIAEMGQRIAGAGKQVGLSESQVLGFAAAVASTGIEVEAGGTAVAMTFTDIDKAVRAGGDGLAALADTAGMSAEEYKKAWGQDAAGATEKFLAGIGQVIRSGGDANAIFDALKMAGVRQTDTLKRLALATDKTDKTQTALAASLQLSASAWDANTALVDEAQKRYETNAAKIAVAWNQIKDAAIDAGAGLAPVVTGMVQALAGLVAIFAALPAPVQAGLSGTVALVGAFALLAGGVMKTITTVAAAKTALMGLVGAERLAAVTSGLLSKALNGVKAAAGPIGAVLAGLSIVWAAASQRSQEAADGAQEYADALRQVGVEGRRAQSELAMKNLQASGSFEAAEKLGISVATLKEAALGSAKAMAEVDAAVAKTTTTIKASSYATGGQAKELGRVSAEGANVIQALKKEHDLRAAAKTLIERERQSTAQVTVAKADYRLATSEASQAVDALNQAVADNVEWLGKQAGAVIGAANAEIGYEQAKSAGLKTVSEYAKAVKFSNGEIDISTKAGQEVKKALIDQASALHKNVEAMRKNGRHANEMATFVAKGREEFLKLAQAAGMGATEATQLADRLRLVPEAIQLSITAPGLLESIQTTEQLHATIEQLPKEQQTEIKTILDKRGLEEAKQRLSELRDKEIHIKTVYESITKEYQPGGGAGRAYGGLIFGTSPHKRADNIPAMLTAGEYVHQVDAVNHYGIGFMEALNRRLIPRENLPRFADGGYVADRRTATVSGGLGGGPQITNTVNVTAYYPQAEPVSVTANRALENVVRLGELR